MALVDYYLDTAQFDRLLPAVWKLRALLVNFLGSNRIQKHPVNLLVQGSLLGLCQHKHGTNLLPCMKILRDLTAAMKQFPQQRIKIRAQILEAGFALAETFGVVPPGGAAK
eukprot:m.639447 g.639447  ORF g.639447 m.639447 type:complete len:111 (+) comp58332_c0_seq28:353-685(+)